MGQGTESICGGQEAERGVSLISEAPRAWSGEEAAGVQGQGQQHWVDITAHLHLEKNVCQSELPRARRAAGAGSELPVWGGMQAASGGERDREAPREHEDEAGQCRLFPSPSQP